CQAVVLKAVNAKACAADVKQFCAGTEAGEGRIKACSKAHFADLTDACKVGLANEAAGED
ncbi:MAG: cysteine rich repeat-containing protein, partial [Methyloceanibacter sp.]